MREKSLPNGCSIQPLSTETLSSNLLAAYSAMVPQEFQQVLEGRSPFHREQGITLALAMTDAEGHPVGIALATYHNSFSLSELHYFHITKEWATQENIEALQNAIEEALIQKKSRIVSYRFTHGHSQETRNKLALLYARGWSRPKRYMLRCYFDAPTFNAPWLHDRYELPASFTLFPWKELLASERQRLLHFIEQGRIIRFTSPFADEQYIQPINSLGLRHQSEVVGWMITHTLPDRPDTIRYSSLFIYPELRRYGAAIQMLATAIQLQQASPIRSSYCEFDLELLESSWLTFIEKRLVPYAKETETIYRISKLLN